jgi:hypothetical protein
VATIAFDDSDTGYAARPPISAHPAFPAIVALWFSALLGLGSMVLPAVLVESALLATGLASLVPALNPPLDLPARGLVALAAALAGALIGLAIARRVASAQERQPAPRFAKFVASTPRQPISVNEELGGQGLVNGSGMPVTRRRALAITEDDRPSDFLYTAPLPGEDPYGPPAPDAGDDANDEEPLELIEAIVEDDTPASFPETATSSEDQPMPDRQEFRPIAKFEVEDNSIAAVEDSQPADQSGDEPLPFAAPSLARRLDHRLGAARECADDAMVAAGPTEPESPADETDHFSADWAAAPPESLGLVQLVQRLGRSIEQRREWLAVSATAPAAVLPPVPAAFEAAPAEEAVQAMAAYFGHAEAPPAGCETETPQSAEPPTRPAPFGAPQTVAAVSRATFLQPFVAEADNEDDTAEDVPDFSLPLRRPAEPAAAASEAEEEDWESLGRGAGEQSYGSLLAMNNPFAGNQEDFVRIDEPEGDCVEPAVVFPSPAPAPRAIAEPFGIDDSEPPPERLFDAPAKKSAQPASAAPQPAPADTESALRSALATLKRMNGAA